tara:strand:+ start:1478 stop:1819 length:342 start_codon:yes stop_codon:yes gene_type:complete
MESKMSEYTPDSWVVLKVKEGKGTFPFYKVLAGWSGGYLYGSSWRMNSGITLVFNREDEIHFHGESGSLYRCPKGAYGLKMSTAGVYKNLCLQQEFGGQIQLMSEDTDWSKLV